MRKIHKYLNKKFPLYSKWHDQKIYTFVHVVVYVTITFLLCSLIYVTTQLTLADSTSESLLTVSSNSTVEDMTTKMLQLAKKYEAASEVEQRTLADSLTTLVLNRKNILKQEIRNNPKKFLTHALPQGVVKQMPESIQALLEREIQIEGTLSVSIAENFKTRQSKVFYAVETPEKKDKPYKVNLTEDREDLLTGAKVKVKGIVLDDEIVVEGGKNSSGMTGGTSIEVTSQATAAAVASPQKTIVIMLNFISDTSQPWTKDQIASTVFYAPHSTNEFHQENSFEQVSFVGDVVGWFTIPYTKDNCDSAYYSWMNAADQAATNSGVSLGSYNRKLYIMNNGDGYCNWGGFAQIGGSSSWAFIFGYNDASINSHELGHSLGVRHASSIMCGSKQIDSYGNCTVDEYGDRSDVMGFNWYSYHQFSALKKKLLWDGIVVHRSRRLLQVVVIPLLLQK